MGAEKFASVHNIKKSYGSYQDLFDDPDIDVVYIGSIADQHNNLATQSITAGKPTVVEKPLCLNLKETHKLIQLAQNKNVFLMEGMWTRCFPAMKKVQELIESGNLGDIVSIQGDFGWSTTGCKYPEHRIWNRGSGGMILDIGMYLVQLGQVAFGSGCDNVEKVQAMGSLKHGVDHTVMANVMYNTKNDKKGFLQFYVTGEANTEERVVIQGTKGRIIIDPPAHIPSRVTVSYDNARGGSADDKVDDKGTNVEVFEFKPPDDSHETWNYPGSIGFTYEIEDVGNALRRGDKECGLFSHEDSLQVATILENILGQLQDSE